MKILVLSALYEPHGIGGSERVARTLATSLRDAGHDVVVLTTNPSGEEEREVDGIRVRSVRLQNVYALDGPRPSLLKPLWHAIDAHNPMMERSVARVLAEERPTLVHSHLVTGFSSTAWAAARKAGVPVVHTLHDHYTVCARSTMTMNGRPCDGWHLQCRLLTMSRRRESDHIAHVVGVSEYVLRRHRELGAFSGVPGSVIPNPCHLVGATQPARRFHAGTQLGFMGRLDRIKGIELLLASVRDLGGDWRLRIAGLGHDDAYVARLRAEYPDPRIEFVGLVEPRDFLGQLDLLVVPSLAPETFGLSAAEAMALGCPVLVSNRGALPELVSPGRNGFVFDADDPAALRRALGEILARPSSLAELGPECLRTVQPFAPSRVAAMYEKVFQSVAG